MARATNFSNSGLLSSLPKPLSPPNQAQSSLRADNRTPRALAVKGRGALRWGRHTILADVSAGLRIELISPTVNIAEPRIRAPLSPSSQTAVLLSQFKDYLWIKLSKLRNMCESQAAALSNYPMMALPLWASNDDKRENWRNRLEAIVDRVKRCSVRFHSDGVK